MQVTGMLYGAKLLEFAGFPTAEVLGPDASEEEIKALIERHGSVFVKPVFKGGVGKKGKAGLIGRATDLKTALKEKERLYFVEHRVGNTVAKANGVTFEGAVPAEHEVYFSITDSTRFRAPTMTLTHHGGVDIEELDKSLVAQVPFDPLTGLKAFVVANALSELERADSRSSRRWCSSCRSCGSSIHNFGMTTLELNPIRMRPDRRGRLTPVACDFKCGFDRDDPRWQRLECAAAPVRGRLLRLRAGDQSAAHLSGPERRLRHQRERHDPRADLRRRRELAGHGDARRRRDHLLRFRRQPALREDEGGGAHLLQALAQADQRPVHHRRQVEQHRHLRDLSRDGRRAARAFQQARADAALRGRSGAAARTWCAAWARCATRCEALGLPVPHLRLRLGHERGHRLRARGRMPG